MADVVVFNMVFEYSGGTPPSGLQPWMTATFDDGGGSGSVVLTLDNVNLVGSEFVSEWNFNLDPMFDPDDLVFSSEIAIGGNGFDFPTTDTEADDFMAGPSHGYDIEFAFSTSGAGGGSHRFGAGESYEVTISGIAGLTAQSFNFLSAGSGGGGPYPTAAHVQSIGGGNSGWVTVPEPTSFALCGLLAIAALASSRRRRI
jgi:hypothetical protein